MQPQKPHPCDYYFSGFTLLFCLFKEIRDYNSYAIRRFFSIELVKKYSENYICPQAAYEAKNAQCTENLQCSNLIRYEHTL